MTMALRRRYLGCDATSGSGRRVFDEIAPDFSDLLSKHDVGSKLQHCPQVLQGSFADVNHHHADPGRMHAL